MDVIDDKDVGELWRRKPKNPDNYYFDHRSEVLGLVRKLVEERARLYFYKKAYGPTPDASFSEWTECMNLALRDFGIDPASYPGEK